MFLEMVLWRGYFRSPTVLALVNVLASNNNAVFYVLRDIKVY